MEGSYEVYERAGAALLTVSLARARISTLYLRKECIHILMGDAGIATYPKTAETRKYSDSTSGCASQSLEFDRFQTPWCHLCLSQRIRTRPRQETRRRGVHVSGSSYGAYAVSHGCSCFCRSEKAHLSWVHQVENVQSGHIS